MNSLVRGSKTWQLAVVSEAGTENTFSFLAEMRTIELIATTYEKNSTDVLVVPDVVFTGLKD